MIVSPLGKGGNIMNELVPIERIENRILLIRGQKVMLDRDLAELYGVETKVLNQAVMRNYDRFPQDFMFQLTVNEFSNLKSQIVTSSWGGVRKLPFTFTEQGIAMLSSVLRSKQAIRVNIMIMRAFVKIRSFLSTHKELAEQFRRLAGRVDRHDEAIDTIVKTIEKMLTVEEKPKRKIGFVNDR
jgi:hypothetical protein